SSRRLANGCRGTESRRRTTPGIRTEPRDYAPRRILLAGRVPLETWRQGRSPSLVRQGPRVRADAPAHECTLRKLPRGSSGSLGDSKCRRRGEERNGVQEISAHANFAVWSMNEITHILCAIEQGQPQASERLLPLVYDELRQLAAQRLAREKE